MADNRLNTRILLRYDTYSNLMQSEIILQPGEPAIAAFPALEPNRPIRAFGMKVGDGQRYFRELPWIQAIAADVYDWAKTETKPTYTATEIDGLAEYIQQYAGGGEGSGSGSGSYQIIYDSVAKKYILQQWNDETSQWENTTSEINFSGILNRLDAIERWANGAIMNIGNIEVPLIEYVYEQVVLFLENLDYPDVEKEHEFVTAVSQTDGKISVSRKPLSTADITSGVLDTSHGGTGLSRVEYDQVLIGTDEGTITTKKFVTEIGTIRDSFATTGAIKDYVDEQTAGLTGAMHFIGESSILIPNHSSVNPQIRGYNFNMAQPGDVILANNAQEFVWSGSEWCLLGDEGSYAVKGSITNSDIADEANIAQSKIEGLAEELSSKVDQEEGKTLISITDYEKLNSIEEYAQENKIEHILLNDTEIPPNSEKAVNLQIPVLSEEQLALINAAEPNAIEHIFINGTEVVPSIISDQPKSINIEYVLTNEDKEKLINIEPGAEVNKIESISFNGGEPLTPDENTKNLDIIIDETTLTLDVLKGARYPNGNTYTDIEIDTASKKLELSHVAATGDISHLIQQDNTYIILNCGTSTTVINAE